MAPHVDAILLDSGNPSLEVKELGGTGRRDWAVSRQIVEAVDVPVWLAGGLNPDNAREAIERCARSRSTSAPASAPARAWTSTRTSSTASWRRCRGGRGASGLGTARPAGRRVPPVSQRSTLAPTSDSGPSWRRPSPPAKRARSGAYSRVWSVWSTFGSTPWSAVSTSRSSSPSSPSQPATAASISFSASWKPSTSWRWP